MKERVRLVSFGGYDDRKPRVRLLLDALRRRDALADAIAIPVWRTVDEMSLPSRWRLMGAALRLLAGLPAALWRLVRSPRRSTILLPYPGTPEIFLVAPLAKLLRRKIVLDAFLPLHDTIVRDRGLVRPDGIAARFIQLFERRGLLLADLIIVDTDQQGDFFAAEFGIDRSRLLTVLVGAERPFQAEEALESVDDLIGPADGRRVVLFYGLLIPLHGLPTILQAMIQCQGEGIHWVFVGKGQLEPLVRDFMASASGPDISYIPWVDYKRLPALIARAHLCLGVFGTSGKAARVIPNKVFQALAMGKPILTRSSAAVDALAARYPDRVLTVPPGDPEALVEAVRNAIAQPDFLKPPPSEMLVNLGPQAGVDTLIARLEDVTQSL